MINLLPIIAYIALLVAVMATFFFILFNLPYLKDAPAAEVAAIPSIDDVLTFRGVLYFGNDNKADCYRHIETGALYYKQGVQFKSALTGRIVSRQSVLIGA